MNHRDVRITWRYAPDDLRPGLMGLMHEAGHALYEQGLPERWQRTPLGNATSLGIHESQSRLWENQVGRGQPFWRWALPLLQEAFPATRGVTVEALWRALHTVTPSLIRVEADEATYNLHIAVRFELERALIHGELEVDDLPGAWDDAYEALLGLRPGGPAEGVLQDIHWGIGHFGYFHTYTLGNLTSAQLFDTARVEIGELDEQLARGELAPLREWLRERVHRHGACYPGPELVERVTGAPLSSQPFLDYIVSTTEQVYGISVQL
jgi:carboxypeptidase Taq